MDCLKHVLNVLGPDVVADCDGMPLNTAMVQAKRMNQLAKEKADKLQAREQKTAFRDSIGASMQTIARSAILDQQRKDCLLYTSPSPRDQRGSRMPSSA